MPTYNYKCEECEDTFSVVHTIKTVWTNCTLCGASTIKKIVVPFTANTDTSFEAKTRHFEKQKEKDLIRLEKDDKFAANITGQDDSQSAARRQKLMDQEQAKRDKQRAAIKRKGWSWSK